jgi:outer membrane receptor protein involved in Fe transport
MRPLALRAGIALFIAIASWAQATTGTIHLTVKDPSGAGMNATGILKNPAVEVSRAFRTDATGAFTFDNLPFGDYQLEVTGTGFTPQTLQIHLQSATVSETVTLALSSGRYAVEVVGVTPLAGVELPADAIPAPVQTVNSRDIENAGALDLADLLNRRLTGVYINENQGNPFQPDVNYRGYTASPLLGTPEGLSVYVDGVRQNQPFGDIVAWDLIPKIAIRETELMPGSNPLFGLNTLGGAVSIQTKDGQTQPGASIEVTGGMYGRRAVQAEYGGASAHTGLNWYLAGNLFREDGWRADSPSEVRQAFSKLGWQHGKTTLALGLAYADNWLTGNGTMDARFLAQNYSSVYSIPDITWNRSPSVNLSLRHDATSHLVFSGNVYFRYIRADTENADINSNSFDQSLYNLSSADIAALTAAGYSGFPTTGNATTEPFPKWRCIAQGLEQADPSERCDGIITQTHTKQNNYGLSGQTAWAVGRHHFTAGFAWDHSSMNFQQASQFGYLNPDRISITPIDAFADGSTSSGGVPVDSRVDLHGLIQTASVFASDTIAFAKRWNFTVSGRYNRTTIANADRLPPVTDGSRGSLDGNYVFGRFNPAAGLTYNPSTTVTLYFSYSESSRAPTAIERISRVICRMPW